MRWTADWNEADGEITYTVTDGYSLRRKLRELGFLFRDDSRSWILTVHRAETERVKRIEAALSAPAQAAPTKPTPTPVGQRSNGPQIPWIDDVLKERSWLYQGEIRFLDTVRRQAAAGRTLSAAQLAKVLEIRDRVRKRKRPHFVPGGSPGLGRRRR